MLDKEKLHKLVDGIDPDKYIKFTSCLREGNTIEHALLKVQKEKSLAERLKELGYLHDFHEHPVEGQVYGLLSGGAQVCKKHTGRSNELIYASADFNEIMATIKYLEGRE